MIKLKRSFKPGTHQRLSQTLASARRSDAIDSPPAAATGEIIENRLWLVFKANGLVGISGKVLLNS